MKRPSNRHFNSFSNWIVGYKPVTREETEFVKHGDDFVALAEGEEGGWFDGVVEDCLSCLPGHLAQVNILSPRCTEVGMPFSVRTSYTCCRSS